MSVQQRVVVAWIAATPPKVRSGPCGFWLSKARLTGELALNVEVPAAPRTIGRVVNITRSAVAHGVVLVHAMPRVGDHLGCGPQIITVETETFRGGLNNWSASRQAQAAGQSKADKQTLANWLSGS